MLTWFLHFLLNQHFAHSAYCNQLIELNRIMVDGLCKIAELLSLICIALSNRVLVGAIGTLLIIKNVILDGNV